MVLRLTLLIGLALLGPSLQAQSFPEKVSLTACRCAAEEKMQGASVQERKIRLEYCIQKGILTHKSDTGFAKLVTQQDIGDFTRKITELMNGTCPVLFSYPAQPQEQVVENYRGGNRFKTASTPMQADLVNQSPKKRASGTPSPASFFSSYIGTFVGITGEELAEVLVQDPSGRYQKFLWLEYFEGSDALSFNPESFKGRKIRVTYEERRTFSYPKKDYLMNKIILSLEFLD